MKREKMMLVPVREAMQYEQSRVAIASMQLANRAYNVRHAARLIEQAIMEAERVRL